MTKKAICAHCGLPVGDARVEVRTADPQAVQGLFHSGCYLAATEAVKPGHSVVMVRGLHADVETIQGDDR